jgi:regulator of sigma E protease
VTVTPSLYEDEENGIKRYVIGIYVGQNQRITGVSTLKYAFYEIGHYMSNTWKSLGLLVKGRTDKVRLSGPVGMAQMVDSSYNVAMDSGGVPDVILTMINLAMFLSINLGILNLIPIPGLDGGRLVFLLIEVVRGKPVSQEKEGIVTMIGVIALIALMVVVLFNDIASL